MKKLVPSLCICLLCIFSSCIAFANTSTTKIASDDYFDDDYYEEDDTAQAKEETFHAWNIFWHNVNDYALTNIAKPAHKGYSKVVQKPLRTGIQNFRENIKTPKRLLNALLQGEFAQAFIEIGRFIINTTTSLGFADVASQHKPLYPYKPDTLCFGYTFAKWGIYEGPYFVIPFWGPSTIREAIGTGFDALADAYAYFVPFYVSIPAETLFVFNNLDTVYTSYDNLKANAFDPYIAIKNAYLENLSYNRPRQ